MPIHSRSNQYVGINAHLNSVLQNEPGDWRGFHTDHITDLRRTLEDLLPEGYLARTEVSIQIDRLDLDDDGLSRIIPDVLVVEQEQRHALPVSAGAQTATAPVAELPLIETLHNEEYDLGAIVVYALDGRRLGNPVTRIELLSPSNKPPHADHWRYLDKREETLFSGIHMIEIDYLHEGRPVLARLPSYRDRVPGAYPYTVLVSIARPSVQEGTIRVYGWQVDDPLPTIEVPLLDEDQVIFNLNISYNHTYVTSRYHRAVVDYEQLPENFASYSEDDQARIERRMTIIKRAVERGLDLEKGPYAADDVGL